MLHTSKPTDLVPAEWLTKPATCPDCGYHATLAVGVIHIGHYELDGEVRESLIWTCSNQCFLQWEHRQFMGNA